MSSLQLYHKWQHLLHTFHPTARLTQIRSLSWLLAAVTQSKRLHLSQLARRIPGRTQLTSRTRRLERLLQNPALRVRTWYQPIAAQLLTRLAGSGEIRLLIDTTRAGRNLRLLVVTAAYRKRSLPLVWTWVRGVRGHSPHRQHVTLLAWLHPLIPRATRVVVAGDTEFGRAALQKQLQKWGWYYVLHQQGPNIFVTAEKTRHALRSLVTRPGQKVWLTEGRLTTKKPVVANVLVYWRRGEEEPWLLATNLPTARAAYQAYRRRMWIETLFGDAKGHGLGLAASRMYHGMRLCRLMLAVALVYVWSVCLGAQGIKRGLRRWVDRTDRRDLSLFRIGLHLVEWKLLNGYPLKITFQLVL